MVASVNMIFLCFMFFFFSSRRRHTRCLSDWSSDVCSSDLERLDAAGVEERLALLVELRNGGRDSPIRDHVAVQVEADSQALREAVGGVERPAIAASHQVSRASLRFEDVLVRAEAAGWVCTYGDGVAGNWLIGIRDGQQPSRAQVEIAAHLTGGESFDGGGLGRRNDPDLGDGRDGQKQECNEFAHLCAVYNITLHQVGQTLGLPSAGGRRRRPRTGGSRYFYFVSAV